MYLNDVVGELCRFAIAYIMINQICLATGFYPYNLSRIILAPYCPMNRNLRPDQTVEEAMRDLCGTGTSNPDCAYAVGLVGTGISLLATASWTPTIRKRLGISWAWQITWVFYLLHQCK